MYSFKNIWIYLCKDVHMYAHLSDSFAICTAPMPCVDIMKQWRCSEPIDAFTYVITLSCRNKNKLISIFQIGNVAWLYFVHHLSYHTLYDRCSNYLFWLFLFCLLLFCWLHFPFDSRPLLACARGTFGADCAQQCDCTGRTCHPVTGECACEAGETGKKCEKRKTDYHELWFDNMSHQGRHPN